MNTLFLAAIAAAAATQANAPKQPVPVATTPAAAPAPVPETKTCRYIEAATGSTMQKKLCLTAAQWKAWERENG
ncbi:MAG: hypothetical protein ACYDD1_08040 [Caulobacteraceae bacterium]